MSNAIAIKSYMNGQGVQRKLEELLGDRKDVFLTSAMQVVMGSNHLKDATPESVFGAVVTAATLNLPVNNNLGFAYIVPFKRKWKEGNRWMEAQEAQFQLGYKGFIQLAQRSGQFKRISACKTYSEDTEQSVYERLTAMLPKQPQGEVTGYIAYFQLLNGFEAHFSMTKDELEKHAKEYSQSYKFGGGIWKDNFDAMATKTVLKLLLSKQAPLSITPALAQAVEADQAIIRDVNGQPSYEYADNQPQQAAIEMDISNDPTMFATVKESIQNGNKDKGEVLSGQAGYIISDQQRQELIAS